MALYKSSSVLNPDSLHGGFRELRATGHGKQRFFGRDQDLNWCFDNGEPDCPSLYVKKVRADYVRKSVGKAAIFAAQAISTGKVKAPVCQNCFLEKRYCQCD
jgi:hypothetical protein